ncbi:MAG: universal stress protein [Nitrosopumilus sp.]|jgi:nucleotide-binding universal stress UspA family protein|nr:universal stress protein [Nitrosopumilus sp.]MDH3824219.1 universal stress protein [Nitrosopumilus sp.]
MAKIFGNILVPYDNSLHSKKALNQALGMAELTGANLTLAHVIPYDDNADKIIQPHEDSMLRHELEFLNPIEQEALKRNIALTEKILYGNTSKELLDFMDEKNFDVVIMGRRGITKTKNTSLGSVSNALVQNAKIPVLVTA